MLNSATSRLAAFAAGLVVLGGAAAGVGAATDPSPPFQDCLKVAAVKAGFGVDNMAADAGHGGEAMVEAVPGADGLHSELAGVTLLPTSCRFTAGDTAKWRFMVKDCKGNALRNFEPENSKLLHLIVVRSDFTSYQHLHPQMNAAGVWSIDLETPRAGRYRAIVDFVIDGRKYVVGTTLVVPGTAADQPVPPPSRGQASTATTSSSSDQLRSLPTRTHSSPSGSPGTASRSATSSPTSAPTATWSRCTPPTSPIRTCTPTARTSTAARSRSTPSFTSAAPTASSSSSR